MHQFALWEAGVAARPDAATKLRKLLGAGIGASSSSWQVIEESKMITAMVLNKALVFGFILELLILGSFYLKRSGSLEFRTL